MTPLDDFKRLTKGGELNARSMKHELRTLVCSYRRWEYPEGVETEAIKGHCDIFHPGMDYAITAELWPVIPMVLLEIDGPTTRPTSTAGQPRPAEPVNAVKDESTPTIERGDPDVEGSRSGTP